MICFSVKFCVFIALQCVIGQYDDLEVTEQNFNVEQLLSLPTTAVNKDFILSVLKEYLKNGTLFFEIGSGDGDHIIYFAPFFPGILFQPSDMDEDLVDLISATAPYTTARNILKPIITNIDNEPENWTANRYGTFSVDYFFASNLFQFISLNQTKSLFKGVSYYLKKNGLFFMYGPFFYENQTSLLSVPEIDKRVRVYNASCGVKNVDTELKVEAAKYDIYLKKLHDIPLPSKVFVWKKGLSGEIS